MSKPFSLIRCNISNIKTYRINVRQVSYGAGFGMATIATYEASNTIPTDWIIGGISGTVLGASASLFALSTGRIAGISGLVGSVLDNAFNYSRRASQMVTAASQYSFVSGLLLAGMYWNTVYPSIYQSGNEIFYRKYTDI